MQILGVGGDINMQISNGTTESWNCDTIRTLFFEPTTEYIKKSLEITSVKEYIRDNRNWLYDTKLYMITGIKIAYGAKGTVTYARNKSIHLHLGVDATPVGVPVQTGPDIGVEKGRNMTQNIGDKEPFVLAFRMQRIKVSAKGETRHRREEGEMLGLDDDDEDEKDEEPVELMVDGLESVDAHAEEFGIRTSWVVGDEGVGDTSNCALAEDD
jgi:hypothetical protein